MNVNKMKKRILFICTHNSARSQMAEGIINSLYPNKYKAYSAGIKATKVNPYSIKVMKEIEIDISSHRSKSLEEFRGMEFDYVITVCDNAKAGCPFFPGKNYIHKGFDDPSWFKGTEEEMFVIFRRVRDEIKDWVEKTFENQ